MALTSPLAIVTGAARGIGYHVSDRLLQSAYRVLLLDVKENEGKEAEDKLRSKHGLDKVTFVKGDVASQSDFKNAFEKAKTEFGRFDLLINNAGIVAERHPERAVAVNLLGPIYGSELALKYMGTRSGGNGGVVINMTSITGLLPYPDTPTYAATKHGLIGLTRSYGHNVHFQRDAVTFMAMCPYYTDTEILREAETLDLCSPKDVESMLMPVERVGEGLLKMLKDNRNGSTLLVLPKSMEYVEIPEELRKIPTPKIGTKEDSNP